MTAGRRTHVLAPLLAASAGAGLVGCGSATTAAPSPPVPQTATSSDGQVSVPDEAPEVSRGTEVTLRIVSDAPVQVHVHGLDEYVRLAEAGEGETTVTADIPGGFEIETHDTGLLVYRLAVR